MADNGIQVLLLPERCRFAGQSPSKACAAKLQRMRGSSATAGETAQLQRHFQCLPAPWAMAALCRQAEYGDAADRLWLRADPIHLQVEMRGARVMAWDTLQLSLGDSDAILTAMRPVFGDAGYAFSKSADGFFYLGMPPASPLPDFTPAPDILGMDLFSVLPSDKKWAALFNECQIILHNHPFNLDRQRRGLPAINGLWFWGRGVLPQALKHPFRHIDSTAHDLRVLAACADADPASERMNTLIDCRHIRDWSQVENCLPADGRFQLDFSDGRIWHWQPRYRWHFWRHSAFGFD